MDQNYQVSGFYITLSTDKREWGHILQHFGYKHSVEFVLVKRPSIIRPVGEIEKPLNYDNLYSILSPFTTAHLDMSTCPTSPALQYHAISQHKHLETQQKQHLVCSQ